MRHVRDPIDTGKHIVPASRTPDERLDAARFFSHDDAVGNKIVPSNEQQPEPIKRSAETVDGFHLSVDPSSISLEDTFLVFTCRQPMYRP